MTDRTVEEVLEAHLHCRQTGDLEGDLQHNYAQDVTIITLEGIFRGHDGVRENARRLRHYFPGAKFEFPVKFVAGRFALLEWRAHHKSTATQDGSDSFVIEDGRIVCQTIRYTVQHAAEDVIAESGSERSGSGRN